MHLERRCVSCATEHRFISKLQELDLLEDNIEQGPCDYKSCFESRWSKTRYCQKHLLCGLKSTKHRSTQHLDAAEIKRIFTSTQWTCGQDFEEVNDRLVKISIGKMPEGMLVDLDIEFSPTSGKIFEVAVCEHHSGTVLVNARIEHHCSNSEPHASREGHKSESLQQILRGISLRSSGNVYGTYKDRSKCNGLLDVHAVAKLFRGSGITTQTYFLTWHKTKKDLTLLRQFFEEAGYDDILPPSNNNCVQMIPQFKRNVPITVHLDLELIFPLLFGNHELSGQNHRALADTQQLRLSEVGSTDLFSDRQVMARSRCSFINVIKTTSRLCIDLGESISTLTSVCGH